MHTSSPIIIIFHTIASVDQYPSFIPFAISADITQKDAHGRPRRAALKVGYEKFGLEEDWESIVHCNEQQGVIEAESDYGKSPWGSSIKNIGKLEVLRTRWKISPMPAQDAGWYTPRENLHTLVQLDIDIKFRNIIHDRLFAQVKDKVVSTMIGAFEKRASELERSQRP